CLRASLSLSRSWEPLLLDRSAVAVDDAAAGQVVGRELHDHTVLGDDADVVLPHLSGDRRQDLVTVAELDAEHRVGQRFGDHTFDLDDTVFLSHSLADASADRSICGGWVMSDAASRGHAEIRRTAPRVYVRRFLGCRATRVSRSGRGTSADPRCSGGSAAA